MYSGSETALRFQLIIADVSVSVDRSGPPCDAEKYCLMDYTVLSLVSSDLMAQPQKYQFLTFVISS